MIFAAVLFFFLLLVFARRAKTNNRCNSKRLAAADKAVFKEATAYVMSIYNFLGALLYNAFSAVRATSIEN
jgi:hypothetical protein